MDSLQIVSARVVPGHRVASGGNNDPRFPGGTLRMQAPFFREMGLDLSPFHSGTVNVSIAPLVYRVVRPAVTFRQVQWHPVEPAEDFSFFDVRVQTPNGGTATGYIYYPNPETKPEHFQQPDVLELLLPFLEGLHYGMSLTIEVPAQQMIIEPSPQL
ncbi:MAG TPA: hypothetical protein VHM91_16950 [Verrucomicrobiales bacterium]|nr:hypothetical protein [Verrucomicrobiales bacterium]